MCLTETETTVLSVSKCTLYWTVQFWASTYDIHMTATPSGLPPSAQLDRGRCSGGWTHLGCETIRLQQRVGRCSPEWSFLQHNWTWTIWWREIINRSYISIQNKIEKASDGVQSINTSTRERCASGCPVWPPRPVWEWDCCRCHVKMHLGQRGYTFKSTSLLWKVRPNLHRGWRDLFCDCQTKMLMRVPDVRFFFSIFFLLNQGDSTVNYISEAQLDKNKKSERVF